MNKRVDIAVKEPDYSLSRGFTFETEQKRIKRRIIVLLSACVCFALISIIFIILFTYSQSRIIEECNEKYNQSLVNVNKLINDCISNEFDFDRKYREIIGELGCARQAVFLTSLNENNKNIINGIYFGSIKLPDQFKLKMPEIYKAINYILEGNDEQGYSMLKNILTEFDKQDY